MSGGKPRNPSLQLKKKHKMVGLLAVNHLSLLAYFIVGHTLMKPL